jgi:hypothetical protein
MKVVKGDLERDEVPGYFTSEWVFLARNQDVLNGWMARQGLDRANNAAQLPFHDVFVGPAPADVLWTDEHASLIPVLRPGLGWPTLIQSLLVVILIFGVLLGLIEMGTAMMPKTR